ncbi:MAG: hypothetical protein WAT68_07895 [Candidatus Nitrotoga sp.]
MNKKIYVFGNNSLAAAKKIVQAPEICCDVTATQLEECNHRLMAVRGVYSSIQRAQYVDEHIAATPVSV